MFLKPSGEHYIDLGCLDAAAIYSCYLNLHLGKPQPAGNPAEPLRGGTSSQQGAEKHVTADPRGRVQDREASVGHRLRICLFGQPQANPERP